MTLTATEDAIYKSNFRTCAADGCLLIPDDDHCPACEFRLMGPRDVVSYRT